MNGQEQACNIDVEKPSCYVYFAGMKIDSNSFFLWSQSISVIIQIFVFLSIGALADYGMNRKRFLIAFSGVAIASGLSFVFVVKSSLYWLAALFYMLGNLSFCAASLFFNSWREFFFI